MPPLRIALFVEGSEAPPPARGYRPLEQIWNECLGSALGLPRLEPIVPISKKHLVAMDSRQPRMSGSSEPLDQLLVRMLGRHPFDAAIVAWDLVPPLRSEERDFCRWNETLDLYRFLSASSLPDPWKAQAAKRLDELSRRAIPGQRAAPPKLEPGMVLALCMEPMFEGLLVSDESAVRRALELDEKPREWPKGGWGDERERAPDKRVLAPAINSLRKIRPKPLAVKLVPGNLRTNKDGWEEFLLRRLLEDDRARPQILSHPISRRLAELASS
jgi:hypothetical protein